MELTHYAIRLEFPFWGGRIISKIKLLICWGTFSVFSLAHGEAASLNITSLARELSYLTIDQRPLFSTENNHTCYTTMNKIIDQNYEDYKFGCPLRCSENSTLSSINENIKNVHNFQYNHHSYSPDNHEAESPNATGKIAAVLGGGVGMLFSTEFIIGPNLETPGVLFTGIRYTTGDNIGLAVDYTHIFLENCNVFDTRVYLPLGSINRAYPKWSVGGGISYYYVGTTYKGEVTNPYTEERKWINVTGNKGEWGCLVGGCYEIKISSNYSINFGIDLRFIKSIAIKYSPDVGEGFQPAGISIDLTGIYPFVSLVVNL